LQPAAFVQEAMQFEVLAAGDTETNLHLRLPRPVTLDNDQHHDRGSDGQNPGESGDVHGVRTS
jgi:hypothetical protein